MLESIGRYRLDSIVGRGAMGLVYKAKDPDIERFVAIKVLNLNSKSIRFTKEAAFEAFKREAKAAGSLIHSNIVTIYEVNFEHEPPYIVMQFIEGVPVSKLLSQNKLTHLGDTLSILEQVASGLDYAHSKNVFHRDIKPANLLYSLDKKAYILDFGVAAVGALATSKYIVGTIGYMPPEQMLNLPVSAYSDQFSFAVTAYELLTGQRPFVGTEIKEVLKEVADGRIPSVVIKKKDLPPALDDTFRKALAYDPERRFSNCQELVEEIRKDLTSEQVFVLNAKSESKLNVSQILEEERLKLISELALDQKLTWVDKYKSWIFRGGMPIVVVLLFSLIWAVVGKLNGAVEAPPTPNINIDYNLWQKSTDEVIKTISSPYASASEVIEAIKVGLERNPVDLVKALTLASMHPNKEVRIEAIKGLGEINNPAVLDVLIFKLTDVDPDVRLNAIKKLSEKPDKKSIGYLDYLWRSDPDPRVRGEAKIVLELLRSK
ncbi:MAG: protein kinase [Deltaproteobacteria bacterium]|nr:protein kinase [Deltaproteobacteria bacterium]